MAGATLPDFSPRKQRSFDRAIKWLMISFGYKGMRSMEPFLVISEQWPEGDERPTIVVE